MSTLSSRIELRATSSARHPIRPCWSRPTAARSSCSTTDSSTSCGSASSGARRSSTSRVDREHWQGFPDEERFQRMYGLSSFFIGEQKVTEELGPDDARGADEEMKVFLATQIADEARHVRFFDRFYSEVGVLDSDDLAGAPEETSEAPQPRLQRAVRRDARLARAHARRGPHEPDDAGRGRSRSTTW